MSYSQVCSDAARLAKRLKRLPKPVTDPALVILTGLPGTGKSHLASALARKCDLLILESDALRNVLFTPPAYSAEENARLFAAVHALIEHLLRKGIPIVMDATSLLEVHREQLYLIAQRSEARPIIVRVTAPRELVHRRLSDRKTGMAGEREDASDAGWDIYVRMEPTVEKVMRPHYLVDTSLDVGTVLEDIAGEIQGCVTSSIPQ
jgi:predicted kinase